MMSESDGRTIAEIAATVGGRVLGDGEIKINSIASVESAGAGEISFVSDAKHAGNAKQSGASCLIVPEGIELAERNLIVVTNPRLAFARAAELLAPHRAPEAQIHPTAIVGEGAQLNENIAIGAYAVVGARTIVGARTEIKSGASIGDDVVIGEDCVIHPNVVIYDAVTVGDRVMLHAGVCLGADGFGYVRDVEGAYVKFPQVGTIIIGDDVEIGAHTCVDRAALGETRIGRGTKIDNLVQIGHNVIIGERVVIASQTGISGSTVIEDDCVIGGQVGFGDHARVERGAIIGSKAGVLPGKIVRGGGVYWGVPVRPLEEYKIINAHLGRLPQMRRELDRLRKQVAELEARHADEVKDSQDG